MWWYQENPTWYENPHDIYTCGSCRPLLLWLPPVSPRKGPPDFWAMIYSVCRGGVQNPYPHSIKTLAYIFPISVLIMYKTKEISSLPELYKKSLGPRSRTGFYQPMRNIYFSWYVVSRTSIPCSLNNTNLISLFHKINVAGYILAQTYEQKILIAKFLRQKLN